MNPTDLIPTSTRPLRPLGPDSDVALLALDVLHLFADRPTLRETAQRTLQQVLDERFPDFDIQAASAAVLEPQWRATQGQSGFEGYRSYGLTDLLLERYWQGSCRVFSDASFLSRHANVETPQAVGVGLNDIQQMLDEWGPLLLECYQQQLTAFWSQPSESAASPWRQLCDLFREQLRIASQALVGEALQVVQSVLDDPDNTERERVQGDAATQAGITFVYEDVSASSADDVLVLSMARSIGERTIALLYTLSGGIEVFSSAQAMEQSWFGVRRAGPLSLRNYLPEHDVFDALTLSLLERQLQVIATIDPTAFADLPSLERRLEQISSPTALLGAFRSGHEARLSTLEDLLPSWLKQASAAQRSDYSRLLASLAEQNRTGTSFLSGIAPMPDFAEQVLKALILADDPTRSDINVRDIEVTLQRVTNSAFEIIDPPIPELRYQSTTSSFAQLAVKNLGALPLVKSQIRYRNGEPPQWMTYDYLRALTTRADIGQQYRDMLQRELLDDPDEASRRQQQFRASMCIQLPLLALELKIRKQLSNQAYRQIIAALQPALVDRQVEGHAMVVRPLGFQVGTDASPDYVLNMFVIGPQEFGRGPHVLYRPASNEPMLEFASWVTLLSAIQKDGPLQSSVLAGLASTTRPVYANGGFLEPHVGRMVFGDFDALESQSVSLASSSLSVDVFSALYQACAQALIEQANGDSVSNSEARWDRLKDFGWALFNLLQPLFDGPLAAIGLLVQLTASVEVLVQSENAENRWEAAADVLMNLALILVHTGSPVRALARAEVSLDRPIPLDNAIDRRSVSATTQAPFGGKARLFYGWTSARSRFSLKDLANLDTFKLSVPPRGGSLINTGEFRGLYQQGSNWYASVEGNWFRVSRTFDGAVIIDPKFVARTGPRLKADEQGRWTYDYHPRLLGGAGLSVSARKKLKKLEKQARTLLAGFSEQVADAKRMSQSNRSPLDVEDLILLKVPPIETAADEIERLTRPVGEESLQPVVDELRDTARRLTELARRTRIEMYKSRNPTSGAVQYLSGQEEISIRKLGGRKDSSAGKGTDFLQEYEIRDTDNNVLWYAHFHYLKKDAPPASFTKAHLKTAAQRSLGLKFQKNQEATGHSVTGIWRGDIGLAMAKEIFLDV
ncbi:MAG: dermonecrotic toxin domain-containing protein [Pseudomonas sp.]|uniref:dermonecrotic toxin domain-containing protein n=1 Tax=Pseudomonas sp. TaxID=306 RepID=UPI003D6F1664